MPMEKKKVLLIAEQYQSQNRHRCIWRRHVYVMACIVVFCIFYALNLPATAMEKMQCGLEEHTHCEACYEKVVSESVELLDCTYENLGVHVHTGECFDSNGSCVCGLANYVIHEHNSSCVDENGKIICQLPVIKEHEHTEECYRISETTAPEMAEPELVCEKPVVNLHIHSDATCYEIDQDGRRLICAELEVRQHSHGEGCYAAKINAVDELSCTLADSHVHAEDCCDETGTLICAEAENHIHGDLCYGTWNLICGQEEHTHTEDCTRGPEFEPNTLRYRGEDYEVILRYEDSAGIPAEAQLVVTELSGEAYQDYLKRIYVAMDYPIDNVEVRFSGRAEEMEAFCSSEKIVSGPIAFARVFDLTILVDGQEFEPENVVEVTICYDETVQVPRGEKIAVHFPESGKIEILRAEKIMPMSENGQPEEKTVGAEFVFLQDSFSLTGTVVVGTGEAQEGTELSTSMHIDWTCKQNDRRTLRIFADFRDDNSANKKITIQVPTGFQIDSYTATSSSRDVPNVEETPVQVQFEGAVTQSELKPATLKGSILGSTPNNTGTWESQALEGYFHGSNVSSRTYGGDIVYTLDDNTQTVELTTVLHINQILLSHSSREEKMDPIVVTIEYGNETRTTEIYVTATEVPIFSIHGGVKSAIITESSEVPGRSGPISIDCSTYNWWDDQQGSFVDEAEFTLTYPKGVFLEPGTVYCRFLGYTKENPIQTTLVNGQETIIEPGHLSVKWEEGEDGGTITWFVKKTYVYHSNDDELGAIFTANTDDVQKTYYKAGDTITGFTMAVTKYQRNGVSPPATAISYTRTLVSGAVPKHIHLIPQNYTRRDITMDFQTNDYTYALGAIELDGRNAPVPGYTNNVFYFDNEERLEITALNLMGDNVRDIMVVTSEGRELKLDQFKRVADKDKKYNDASQGLLMQLSEVANQAGETLKDGEYIRSCLFTVDLSNEFRYNSVYTFGSFIYYGQFQDGNLDGNREGNVTLRLLQDGTTYEQVKVAVAAGNLDDLNYINADLGKNCIISKNNCTYNGKPVKATDHTTIGWNNTLVTAVTVRDKNAETNKRGPYFPNDTIQIFTTISGGGRFENQSTLIDPDLIISLPEGLTLNTASVRARSMDGKLEGEYIQLEQVKETDNKKIDNVEWKIYRFRVPEEYRFALVAHESKWGGTAEQTIDAYFDVVVEPGCPYYDLDYADILMWDVNNRGYNEETQNLVDLSTKRAVRTDANFVVTDSRNILGYGTEYTVAAYNLDGKLNIHRNIGLTVDIGLKAVKTADAAFTDEGYITYNGLASSIVSVVPGEYADLRLDYYHNSNSSGHEGTVIYLPIPKAGVEYEKFFQNISLRNPRDNETSQFRKAFEFTMDLLGDVEMTSDETKWTTYYAVIPLASELSDRPALRPGQLDNWEPVRSMDSGLAWQTADQVTTWSEVTMVKFVANGDVPAQSIGEATMRFYVHNVGESGQAVGGTYDYWRGYGKIVTNKDTHQGDWLYTSVVAATPATESLVGQIFVDMDQDGIHDAGEPKYRSQKYTVELRRTNGQMDVKYLHVNEDGSFALKNSQGEQEYLAAGTYKITIRRNAEPNFCFANTEYNGSVGDESPENGWTNNVSSSNGTVAEWEFTIINDTQKVHRLGIGLKPRIAVELKGQKTLYGDTLRGGAFTFILREEGKPEVIGTAVNRVDGSIIFDDIFFEMPGTYTYEIAEEKGNAAYTDYDSHASKVTVTVTADSFGILSAQVSYDNSNALTETDRNTVGKAAFTNRMLYELPETGGMGTTLFGVLGGILIFAAVVLLVARKRVYDTW